MIEIGHRLATGIHAIGWENWVLGELPPGLDSYFRHRRNRGRSVPDLTSLRGPAPREWRDLVSSYFRGYPSIVGEDGRRVSHSVTVPRLHWAFSLADVGRQIQNSSRHEEYFFPESSDQISFDTTVNGVRISSNFAIPIVVDGLDLSKETDRFARATVAWLAAEYPDLADDPTYREKVALYGL